jgi:hypothetical protein
MQLSIFLSTIFIGLTIATPSGTIEEGPNKVLRDFPSRETEANCIVNGESLLVSRHQTLNLVALAVGW